MDEMRKAIFEEHLQSRRTSWLFLGLSLTLLLLGYWRVGMGGLDVIGGIAYSLGFFFLFYFINYRTLHITIDDQSVRLKFGVLSWVERAENIVSCEEDELNWLQRNGGAGVHFMMVDGRYRVSFNFLEHERVVLRLKRRRGPVRDVSFSTKKVGEIVEIVNRLHLG
jgi:hypothetical protein